jgi:hypothetical protein
LDEGSFRALDSASHSYAESNSDEYDRSEYNDEPKEDVSGLRTIKAEETYEENMLRLATTTIRCNALMPMTMKSKRRGGGMVDFELRVYFWCTNRRITNYEV